MDRHPRRLRQALLSLCPGATHLPKGGGNTSGPRLLTKLPGQRDSRAIKSCRRNRWHCVAAAAQGPRSVTFPFLHGLDAPADFCIVLRTGRHSSVFAPLRRDKPNPARMSPTPKKSSALAAIEGVIHVIRGERVILDADLAKLYGVETRALNQAVRRNHAKFPPDFLLELTGAEAEALRRSRSQIVTLKRGGNVKHLPFAFTEHGAIMAANILNSPQAVQMSVFVVRALLGSPPREHLLAEPLHFVPGPRLAA